MVQYLPYVWPTTGFIALTVGLAAFGFDVLKMFQLKSLRAPLQYVAGAAGAVSVIAWFYHRNDMAISFPGKGDATLASVTWLVTGLVALFMGLEALGCDVLKVLNLRNLRKPLQYVVGIVGAYSLICYFGMMD